MKYNLYLKILYLIICIWLTFLQPIIKVLFFENKSNVLSLSSESNIELILIYFIIIQYIYSSWWNIIYVLKYCILIIWIWLIFYTKI